MAIWTTIESANECHLLLMLVFFAIKPMSTAPLQHKLRLAASTCFAALSASCFCQCISENCHPGSSRLLACYLDWSQRCTQSETSRYRTDWPCPTNCWHSTTLQPQRLMCWLCKATLPPAPRTNLVSTSPKLTTMVSACPPWLQLVPVIVARDSKFSPLSIHWNNPPSELVQRHRQRWLYVSCFRILQQLSLRSFYLPKHLPPITEEPPYNSLTYTASLYHPSNTISQITPARIDLIADIDPW